MAPVPESVVAAGTPAGTPSTVTLPEDAWDMLGLGVSDAMSEKALQIKNGQVGLLTAADYFSSRQSYELEQRDSYRQQWQYEAEQRIARLEAKKSPLEKAGEAGLMKTQKFAWSKEGQKSFEWRKIYHALVGGVGGLPEGGLMTEAVISPTAMRMYTDHRVMGAVVLPGVSHVSLMAATGSIGFPSPGGMASDWHMSIKETLFERPYIVNSGAELIAAIASGANPSEMGGGGGPMQAAMLPVGVPMTYCRATSVSKERGQIKPTMDWAK
mmetsp:Transcript_18788/g.49647  ORF Transcript_18788/g.49647 Transcript_18788/m.49647 type:complete len:269 (+) Transcript_18788:118-924(+)